MSLRYRITLPAVVAALLLLSGCGDFGEVEQGIVVATDGTRLTLVLDSNPGDPRYDRVPAVAVAIPEDSSQMGPAAEAGGLIAFDSEAKQLTVYDTAAGQLKQITVEIVELTGDIYPDDPRVAASGAPKVDSGAGTVTLYAPRSLELATVKVPVESLSMPPDTWKAGDEVRYYYKDPAQALRLMNVSKSNVR